ncbi:MAG: hypothetical protein RHS_5134 [Robinsoniella sp. RHS]|nr:MAG: hypothetical protein RHS_5134 [Robinsoniella sp. RHS]
MHQDFPANACKYPQIPANASKCPRAAKKRLNPIYQFVSSKASCYNRKR